MCFGIFGHTLQGLVLAFSFVSYVFLLLESAAHVQVKQAL